jgi:dipeptidyl-peptidase-4
MKTKHILLSFVFISAISCTSNKVVVANNNVATEKIVESSLKPGEKEITVGDIWARYKFFGSSVRGVRSMKDGKHFTTLGSGAMGTTEVNKFSYATYEKVGKILSSTDLKDENGKGISIDDYHFNADETKVLIATKQESIYRRSSKAYYYIYDLKTKTTTPLSKKDNGKQRLAEFSPTGNHIAFVRKNNMFFVNLKTGKEFQITKDGVMNKTINGATDCGYEEEFANHKGFQWNADGTKIAYYKFDESDVKEFHIDYYESLYPREYRFKYPKAGEDNSKISIHVYDIWLQESKRAETSNDQEYYIPRIQWTNDPAILCITELNRLQNSLKLLQVNCTNNTGSKNKSFPAKSFFTETAKTYIDIHDNLTFLKDNKTFLWLSEKDGYNHIYLNTIEGKEKQITKGSWDVAGIEGIDEENGLIYYISTETGATQKQLFVVKTDGTGKKNLSRKTGSNSVAFSKGFKYFINYHSDANSPKYITLNKANGDLIKVLEDNKALKGRLAEYNLSKKEFIKINTANGYLNAWTIKPANFDKNKVYPVFMTGYNGPGSNKVTDSWDTYDYMWHQLLAQKGFLIVCVETRGTMYRGRDFKHSTYLQLGKYETEDMIDAAKYIGGLPYADAKNIGIYGWSYGGYMSALCMTKGAEYFKAGIAVAPVTNWRYYDNIYTERFMRTPQENAKGYDDNSPINYVNLLKGPFLLIHGGGDDNVHPQNTYEMTNAFINANKDFDMFIYPNCAHSIACSRNARFHLFTKMTKFLEDNLK